MGRMGKFVRDPAGACLIRAHARSLRIQCSGAKPFSNMKKGSAQGGKNCQSTAFLKPIPNNGEKRRMGLCRTMTKRKFPTGSITFCIEHAANCFCLQLILV